MKISVITPTCDRPVAFALVEAMVARQTLQPDEWIVADGGSVPAQCTMGQIHIHRSRPLGAQNFAYNLLNGAARATGDVVAIAEDDDWLAPTHLETLIATLRPEALLAGDGKQRYY